MAGTLGTFIQRGGPRSEKLLRQLICDSAKRNGKEELLELLMDLCSRSEFVTQWELILCELAPFMEDNRSKVKMRTLDVLVAVS